MSVKSQAAHSPYFIYRHKLPIRIMHWTNVVCFVVLLMSGLNIFNAHAKTDNVCPMHDADRQFVAIDKIR